MSDLSRFLKELDEQTHNDSVFSMFDDFDKKYADFTAREREWQEAFDAERKAKAEKINRYQQWDAHISEESVKALMPELNNYIDSFPTTDAIDLNGYSTDELKSRLEKARATHADLLSDAEILGESESAKDCIKEQSALISLYRQELDRRAETSEPSQADIDKANAERVARINKVIEDNERFMDELDKRITERCETAQDK